MTAPKSATRSSQAVAVGVVETCPESSVERHYPTNRKMLIILNKDISNTYRLRKTFNKRNQIQQFFVVLVFKPAFYWYTVF